jgi:hypothetical protein
MLAGLDLDALVLASMYRLLLAMPPGRPKQSCGLIPLEPPIACVSLGWERDSNQCTMKVLPRMVIDGGSEILDARSRVSAASSRSKL